MNINLLNRQPPIYLQTLIFDIERGSCTAPRQYGYTITFHNCSFDQETSLFGIFSPLN